MQFFVRRYDGADSPHDGYEKIEANSPKDAAEKACGETLTEEGKPMRLRATVRVPPNPSATAFYALPENG